MSAVTEYALRAVLIVGGIWLFLAGLFLLAMHWPIKRKP